MSDDIYKKLKSILSGSTELNTLPEGETQEDQIAKNEELVNNFMNQILDSAWVEEDLKATFTPSFTLDRKEKTYWLMNVATKTLMPVSSGVEIIPLEKSNTHTLCLIGYNTFNVPNKIIVNLGWN